MHRQTCVARDNYMKRNAEVGFDFGKLGGEYWQECAGYHFTKDEVCKLEVATVELWEMTLDTIEDALYDDNFIKALQLSPTLVKWLRKSWERPNPSYSVYGRFDLFFDGNEIKLYEFNGDTPTSLLESSLVQYYWMKDRGLPDQFNSIHEKLIATWKWIDTHQSPLFGSQIHFASVKESQEDYRTVEYLMDTAHQAGFKTHYIATEDIGAGSDGQFYDLEKAKIQALFKLYPWEWAVDEAFADTLLKSQTDYFEPPWKMICSNKAFLVKLWEKYEGHDLLLPTFWDRMNAGDFVRKPIWGREGEGVVMPGQAGYWPGGTESTILQAYKPLPDFDGYHPVIGSWIIGDEPAGIGIREDKGLVTGNTSSFVPHWFS